MNTAQYNHLFSFIWNIANDVLVHAFEKGEYKKIIMPMMVLRRLDILLEPTKDAVLERKKQLDAAHIVNQEPILFQTTGYPFCNTDLFQIVINMMAEHTEFARNYLDNETFRNFVNTRVFQQARAMV